jgi:hypothetical protein
MLVLVIEHFPERTQIDHEHEHEHDYEFDFAAKAVATRSC